MESEESLSREKQNLEQNPSVENSSSLKNTAQKPLVKETKSQSLISPENKQKISNEQTQCFIDLALKDLHHSREVLEKELKEPKDNLGSVNTPSRTISKTVALAIVQVNSGVGAAGVVYDR